MNTVPPSRLTVETEFYEAHKSQWLQDHGNKFVVIKERELLGFFADFRLAYTAGVEKYGMDKDFLVKRVLPHDPVFVVF